MRHTWLALSAGSDCCCCHAKAGRQTCPATQGTPAVEPPRQLPAAAAYEFTFPSFVNPHPSVYCRVYCRALCHERGVVCSWRTAALQILAQQKSIHSYEEGEKQLSVGDMAVTYACQLSIGKTHHGAEVCGSELGCEPKFASGGDFSQNVRKGGVYSLFCTHGATFQQLVLSLLVASQLVSATHKAGV